MNAKATDAVERVSGKTDERLRADVKAERLFWWADLAPDGYRHELRFTRSLAQVLHRRTIREARERAERLARNPSAGIAMPYLTQLVSLSLIHISEPTRPY